MKKSNSNSSSINADSFLTPPPKSRNKQSIIPGAPKKRKRPSSPSSTSSISSTSYHQTLIFDSTAELGTVSPAKSNQTNKNGSKRLRRIKNQSSLKMTSLTATPPPPSNHHQQPSTSLLIKNLTPQNKKIGASLKETQKFSIKKKKTSSGYVPKNTFKSTSINLRKERNNSSQFSSTFASRISSGRRIVPDRSLGSSNSTLSTKMASPNSNRKNNSNTLYKSLSFTQQNNVPISIIGSSSSSGGSSSGGGSSGSSSNNSNSVLNQLYGMAIPKHIKHLYSTIRGAIGSLGGAGAGGAIYGEVTMTSFHRLVLYLQSATKLHSDSIFIDIGAGLGKPNLHVAAYIKCASIGIELIGSRWWRSLSVLKAVVKKDINVPPPVFIHANLMDCKTLLPLTHVYSFDRGFPPHTLRHMFHMFNISNESTTLITYQTPKRCYELGLNSSTKMIKRFPMKMCGSGEQHSCFIYVKKEYILKINKTQPNVILSTNPCGTIGPIILKRKFKNVDFPNHFL